jgi:hypothetical protein
MSPSRSSTPRQTDWPPVTMWLWFWLWLWLWLRLVSENQDWWSSRGNEYTSYRRIEHVKRNLWRRCLLVRRPDQTTSVHSDNGLILSTMTDKWQTRTPVREGAPHGQDSNVHLKSNIWWWAPAGARHQDRQMDWPSIEMWLWLWLEGSSE